MQVVELAEVIIRQCPELQGIARTPEQLVSDSRTTHALLARIDTPAQRLQINAAIVKELHHGK